MKLWQTSSRFGIWYSTTIVPAVNVEVKEMAAALYVSAFTASWFDGKYAPPVS